MDAAKNPVSDIYLGSREGDPSSLVENVSTIHGDYSEVEVDLVVSAPDSLVLSRFYSSRDDLKIANFGGWRFNPHCYLTTQKDLKTKPYSTAEGHFERVLVYVGNPDGAILTYVGWQNSVATSKRTLFKIDPNRETPGVVNTAKGNISSWTNQKNNEIFFDPRTNTFEMVLPSGHKRVYEKALSGDVYLLTHEVFPSGNKVFYKYDDQNHLELITEKNPSEKKVLGWVQIHYGPDIRIDASDGQHVTYRFEKNPSGCSLLSEVHRSNKPDLKYRYRVIDQHAVMWRKDLPEGRFVQIDYYTEGKDRFRVKAVTTPANLTDLRTTDFSYGENVTEVHGPGDRKVVYYFDDKSQLTSIEHYLEGNLYRVHRKYWGSKTEAGNLLATSVENSKGQVFYYKSFTYDEKSRGNILSEKEYGNLTGDRRDPIILDEEGVPGSHPIAHVKTYEYRTAGAHDVVLQKDMKGNGIEFGYKKGTNILLWKFCLVKNKREKRWFYDYDEEGSLIRVQVDDGSKEEAKATDYLHHRLITFIYPKQDLPNMGAPEIIEEKYLDLRQQKEILLKKTVNKFDSKGNLAFQEIYDANDELRYSLKKGYDKGLLILESDPIGNEIRYEYDLNQNLILEEHSGSGISIEYGYDSRNHLISKTHHGKQGEKFVTEVSYDALGDSVAETDRFGNKTVYTYDDLGRLRSVCYPSVIRSEGSNTQSIYTYTYDLFDHETSITNPIGEVTSKVHTVHGQVAEINYSDGTLERLKYDLGGALFRHEARDGTSKIYKYDSFGRVIEVERFGRNSKSSSDALGITRFEYDAFYKTKETSEAGHKTIYTYDYAGFLTSLKYETNNKIFPVGTIAGGGAADFRLEDYIYDSLGRLYATKKWKSSDTFTLYIKGYDLLGRVIEERMENQERKVLVKYAYEYDPNGEISHIKGYPQNQESILARYEYDGVGRQSKIFDAFNQSTEVIYDDNYINAYGQKVLRSIQTDPLGSEIEEIFDIEGHLVKRIKKDRDGQLLLDNEFEYDLFDNKILEKDTVIMNGRQLSCYATSWAYKSNGHLESICRAKGSSKERVTRFGYNQYGDLISNASPEEKNQITYQHNTQGQVIEISYKNPGATKKTEYRLSYGRNGSLAEIKLNSSEFIECKFNILGQALSESIKDEWGRYEIRGYYDGEGCLKCIQLPDQTFIEYEYEGPFVKQVVRSSKEKENLYFYQVAKWDFMGRPIEETLGAHVGGQKQFWDLSGKKTGIENDFFRDQGAAGGFDVLKNLKKRETFIEGDKYETHYDYDALGHLISEKRERIHSYDYDSMGNRLQKDDVPYKINELNELIEAEDEICTFDLDGNLATKSIGKKTWVYQWNPLKQLIQVTDPDKNEVKFTYDPRGRRLSKKVESKDKKAKIFRYFYLGDIELGSVDEKGEIVDLKVPADPNKPESTHAVAFEIRKKTKAVYIPIYDLQGNVSCLVDGENREIVESYRYTAFGEEEIFDERGRLLFDSIIGNSWRYRGKRADSETGLVYFGYRYYDPKVGRWISPDPLGEIDGPNLYSYARNNPISYTDHFGLSATTNDDPDCRCGHCLGNEFCHCMGSDPTHDIDNCACKGSPCVHKLYGGPITARNGILNALYGMGHGTVDFMMGNLHDLQTMAAYMGSGDLDINLYERIEMIAAIEEAQNQRMRAIERGIMGMLEIDASDGVYQSFRSKTTLGLEVGSLASGGYGLVKGVIGFSRLARMPGFHKIDNAVKVIENFLGGKGRVITNVDSDMVLMRGNKKIRFDIRDPHGDKPHFHLEQRSPNGKWIDASPEHRYYFTEE